MKAKKIGETAMMEDDSWCIRCGWPVVFACCNDEMSGTGEYDWWLYCANKGCTMHVGTGVYSGSNTRPPWIADKVELPHD